MSPYSGRQRWAGAMPQPQGGPWRPQSPSKQHRRVPPLLRKGLEMHLVLEAVQGFH